MVNWLRKKLIPSYTRLQGDGAVQERSHVCSIRLVSRAHPDTILLENVFQQIENVFQQSENYICLILL